MTVRTARIDVSTDHCPMTFVRTRLALDRLATGDILVVRLRGAEPKHSVAASATALGHTILEVREDADGTTELTLRRG